VGKGVEFRARWKKEMTEFLPDEAQSVSASIDNQAVFLELSNRIEMFTSQSNFFF
jgi:hypothetical protein